MGRRRYQRPNVRRTQSKHPQWWFKARTDVIGEEDGERRRVEIPHYLGYCKDVTKREAEKARDAILEKINHPQLILTSQVPFGSVLDSFEKVGMEEIGQVTRQGYESLIKVHFRPVLGKLRMCDLTPLKCREWIVGLRSALAPRSRQKAVRLFRQIWEFAVEIDCTQTVCPLRKYKVKGDDKREKTLPTVEQFRAMLAILEEPYASMLAWTTFTGMRIGEVMAMRGHQMRGESLVISESRTQGNKIVKVKTGKPRVVPIGHLQKPAITDPNALVFDVAYQTGLYHLKAAAKTVGIEYPGFGWHTFRRAHATWFERSGGSREDSQAQLGHSTPEQTGVYVQPGDPEFERRAAAEREMFERVMFSQKGGRA